LAKDQWAERPRLEKDRRAAGKEGSATALSSGARLHDDERSRDGLWDVPAQPISCAISIWERPPITQKLALQSRLGKPS
jgi:hypothetical protein